MVVSGGFVWRVVERVFEEDYRRVFDRYRVMNCCYVGGVGILSLKRR